MVPMIVLHALYLENVSLKLISQFLCSPKLLSTKKCFCSDMQYLKYSGTWCVVSLVSAFGGGLPESARQ